MQQRLNAVPAVLAWRANAASVAAPIVMWSGWAKMPSGPNVPTTVGCSSSRIAATTSTSSSNGTWSTSPSR